MFGASNTFGQSPTSNPFGTQSVFGQSNNTSSNPFAPRTNATPFGAQPGGSIFGGNSTGVFGAAQTSSPLGFGASSSSAFGASSTPAFGNSSSPFGGSSAFGQQPAFGGFGSSQNQPSPFGSTSQQSQPAFGNSQFGSSAPFGASSQTSFAATNPPSFGSTSTQTFGSGTGSAFGNSNASTFGATSNPTFGTQTASAFKPSNVQSLSMGSAPAFGQSTSAFGTNQNATTSPFGASNSQFGAQGQSAFGAQQGGSRKAPYTQTNDADGSNGLLNSISAMPAFSDKSHEELRWEDFQLGDKGGRNPSVQSSSGIGIGTPNSQSNPFTTSSTIGQSSSNPFSMQTPSNPLATKPSPFASATPAPSSGPAFSSSPFAGSSTSAPAFSSTPIGALSTSASAFSSSPFNVLSTSAPTFSSSPFGVLPTSAPAFSSSPFGVLPTSAPAFSSSSFSASSTSGANSSAMPSMFGSTTGGSSPSIFGSSVAPSFAPSPSLFGSTAAQGTTPSFASFGNTQSSSLFQSTAPSFGQSTSSFGNMTAPTGQPSLFNTSSAGGNMFSSIPSLFPVSSSPTFTQTTPSLSTPLQSGQPAQPTGAFSIGNFGQTQSAGKASFAGLSNNFGQSTSGPLFSTQSPATLQPAPVRNPFGTLPAVPRLIIGQSGTTSSVQYGISSMPVVDKAAPVRISSLLTARNVSQRRITVGARKYLPKPDIHKVSFFGDDEETRSTPRADALFIPRENPRALVIRPIDQWPLRAHSEKAPSVKETSVPLHENGKPSTQLPPNGFTAENTKRNEQESTPIPEETNMKSNQKTNGFHDDHSLQNGSSHTRLTGNKSGEATRFREPRADAEALMPKLSSPEYYTQPRIEELAAKERAEPGFCGHVNDFVIGRHGYGSIKFFGGTDVRGLDFGSLVQFNNREVIVYMDDGNKPPVGQGLNKPAEVTLLNIKCFDKKTGVQYTEGPKMGRYIDMLKKKAEDQGTEFVSYDPVKGEWKFKVSHFSIYKLEEEDHY